MVRRKKSENSSTLDLIVAVALNFIFVGLGQAFQKKKNAKWIIILGIIFGLLCFVLIGIPLYVILWLYAQYNVVSGSDKK